MRPLICVLIFAAAALAAGPARAQAPVPARVLVMPFVVEADPSGPASAAGLAWLGEAAALVVADEFEALGLDTLSRDERVAAFDRLQLPLFSNLTRATMIRAGELLGASDIVVGEVRVGPELLVRARLIQLETGVQRADLRDQDPQSALFALFTRVATMLAHASGHRLAVARRALPRPALDVFENYIKGLMSVAPATQQRFLEAAYQRAPRDARVLLALWSAYTEQGQHAKALAAARSVPAESPLVRKARFSAALSLIDLARLNEAFKTLSDLQTERPAPAVANALGVVQLRRGNSPDGRPAPYYFNQAVEAAPEQADYLFNLGYAYAVAKDPAAALFWLREAVRFDAADGDAHYVMSAVLTSTDRAVEAQRELDLARLLGTRRDLAPEAPRDRVPAGWERLEGDLEAASALRVASVGNPARREQQEAADFHLHEARRLLDVQRDREAIDELRRAVYLSPYRDEPHLLLGQVYQRVGRLPEAIDEFKVAIWCRETVDARLALATVLLATGDTVAARREVERVLVLQPDSADGRALLRRIDG